MVLLQEITEKPKTESGEMQIKWDKRKEQSITDGDCAGHFPGMLVYPGVRQVDSVMSLATLSVSEIAKKEEFKNPQIRFLGYADATFRDKIVPDDKMLTDVVWEKIEKTNQGFVFTFTGNTRTNSYGVATTVEEMRFLVTEGEAGEEAE